MNDKFLWPKVLEKIKATITPLSYRTWFEPIDFFEIQNNTIKLIIPVSLYKNHLEQNYKQILLEACNDIFNVNIVNIDYLLKEEAEL